MRYLIVGIIFNVFVINIIVTTTTNNANRQAMLCFYVCLYIHICGIFLMYEMCTYILLPHHLTRDLIVLCQPQPVCYYYYFYCLRPLFLHSGDPSQVCMYVFVFTFFFHGHHHHSSQV